MKGIRNVVSRRAVVGTVMAGGALALGTGLGLGRAAAAGAPATRIRRSINDPVNGEEIAEIYRAGVAKLRALDPGNPLNWLNQADIHRNHCPHGNWYFVPWHRAYVAAVEALIADVTGQADFAMPYWNWSVDRILPPAVAAAEIGGVANPLYDATRTMQPGETLGEVLQQWGIDADAIYAPSVIDTIVGQRPFQVFGSLMPQGQNSTDPSWQRVPSRKMQLESQPHDMTHGAVGGNMGQVPLSSRDPVFYMHHCNIDRIWARYQAGGGPADNNPNWWGFTFVQNFQQPDGTSYDVVVGNLLDTVALGYRYDDVAAPALVALFSTEFAMPAETRLEVIASTTSGLVATAGKAASTRLSAGIPAQSTPLWAETLVPSGPRVFAFLDDIEVPGDPRVGVRVFVNAPSLEPGTGSDSPYYAGAFTFFAGDHGHEGHGGGKQSVAIDITDALAAARRAGAAASDEIVVQLLPHMADESGAPASIAVGSIAIAVL
jgi:tyrosinase